MLAENTDYYKLINEWPGHKSVHSGYKRAWDQLSHKNVVHTGADPEIEEGGHTYRVGIGAVRVGRSCLCAC